jgi:glutathione S-transferase
MSTKYKLVYFNGRGLAETSRIIFHLAQINYEDFRYPMEVVDWATFNIKKEEFDQDKKDGKLLQSLNKLPFLVIQEENKVDVVLSQSKAIERYLASSFGFMGKSPLENAQVDAICEVFRDLKQDYQTVKKSLDKDVAMRKWFGETLPAKLLLLEGILHTTGFCVGDTLSLADITLYCFCRDFFDDKDGISFSIRGCPKINVILTSLDNNSHLQDWRNQRPDSSF